ncbi:hypothetical protein ABL78_5271 [Leptomonas seymouri]|uniref:PH-like domain-containing protein n=1 Tax=Leptomonas seymouri TaxID=5684 RepID=A0A0N1PBB1_LEPSE|nr:hypothetical protein ABL78_5271 [Leptomonas seymouri]|eukprot:KPI85691.1 hypothetical protein ABL78_5271 [Leptomonas seymouri]
MQHFPEASGARAPASSLSTSASCSVDALERVVHFTGAGVDACFYANLNSTSSSPESLRYWLNPSVRARPTIATCEIANLGAPFFSPVSISELHVAVSPLFQDGRCFPTRCVLSLATSAQRLDGVSVRPVVIKEWDLNGCAEAAASESVFSPAPQPRITAIPLRTLYHIASLLDSSNVANMNEVRLYVQLRFTGCTDASDTHRIAAVRLVYEHLGPAEEVFPLLQRRRQGAGFPSPSANSNLNAGGFRASTSVEEVEVTIHSSSSSQPTPDDATPRTPPRRTEKYIFMSSKDADDEPDSPPHRSATKPRAEKPWSSDCDRLPTHIDPHEHIRTAQRDKGNSAELVRVERALRLPPPPPLTAPLTEQHCTKDKLAASSVLRDPRLPLAAPWPPRKIRTIVLAPSISPSLSSTSASGSGSLLSSPGSGAGSTPLSHSSVTCGAIPLAGEGKTEMSPLVKERDARGPHLESTLCELHTPDGKRPQMEGPPFAASSLSPPPRQRSESLHLINGDGPEPPHQGAYQRERSSLFLQDVPALRESVNTQTNSAILWEAASLLGTAPWKLCSLQNSRRASPAVSARNSRASSRERSSGASAHEPSITVAEAPANVPLPAQTKPPVSFLSSAHSSCTPPAWRETFGAHAMAKGPSPLRTTAQQKFEMTPNSSFLGWGQTSERSRATAAASTSTASSFPQWRSTLASGAATRVSPQLHPPRTAAVQTSNFVSQFSSPLTTATSSPRTATAPIVTPSASPPSAYVPRLCFRTASRRDAPTQQYMNGSTAHRSRAAPASTLPPPSQNKNLWMKPAKASAADTGPQNVVAEYGQSMSRRKPRVSSAAAAPQSVPTAHATKPAAVPPAGNKEASSGPLSVIPVSWLQSVKAQPTQPKQRDPIVKRTSKRERTRVLSERSTVSAAEEPTGRQGDSSSASSSPAASSLTETFTAAPPPPAPPLPPPQNRVLFHDTASSFNVSQTKSSAAARLPSPPPPARMTQRNGTEAAVPALPLQEHHHLPSRAPNDRSHLVQTQRRSRSAPDSRSGRSLSPSVSLLNKSLVEESEAQVFSVLKHHASRNGVGRRRLRIRLATSRGSFNRAAADDPSDVRLFIALEKLHGMTQLRDSIGLGGRGTRSGSSNSACEVPIFRRDAVEVWTGVQACNSGVIHKEKVRNAECCLVIRCNRQLVTAVEMETVQAVDTVSRLLLSQL